MSCTILTRKQIFPEASLHSIINFVVHTDLAQSKFWMLWFVSLIHFALFEFLGWKLAQILESVPLQKILKNQANIPLSVRALM